MKIDGNIAAQVALQARNTAPKAPVVAHETTGTKGEKKFQIATIIFQRLAC